MPSYPVCLHVRNLSPERALLAWPEHIPLAALWSAPGPNPHADNPHSRWVILARPDTTQTAHTPTQALQLLQQTFRSLSHAPPGPVPFIGGWVAALGYDLGAALEPAVLDHPYPADRRMARRAVDDRGWPPLILQRCDTALIHDRLEHRWWGLGSDAPDLLRLLADAPPAPDRVLGIAEPLQDPHARARYTGAVADAIGLIHAGDAYQVNLAHRLTWHFRGSPLALFRRVAIRAVPWYGGFMRFHHEGRDHALCSASPELLLGLDARSRIVTTRPMKGTRPGRSGSDELRDAPKDRAELAMIVDLARNDLGRVCRLGSVRVREPRELETHAGGDVLQATATVAGVLRRDRSLLDLVRALFPAASVTGAPKIRAMQIIDRLEAVRRGPYCGALGFVSDCGNAAFNVMIRTGAIVGTPCPDGTVAGTLDYAVGAGIVADSDPEAEWEETLVKARPFIRALERPAPFLPHPVSTTRQ